MEKSKIVLLKKIAQEIARCRVCKRGKIGKPVPGEGNPNAKIVFIGEAPGREEAKVGRPFVGRSGRLLRAEIQKIDLRENNVFITSPVKYLPKRGTPTRTQIAHGRIHLLKQFEVINPEIIVLLGSVACRAILEESVQMRRRHGTYFNKERKTYFITFHPAAALRSTKTKRLFQNDFQRLSDLVKQR